MATLLRNQDCPSCGKQHHFTNTDGDLSKDKVYDYGCPETGARAHLRPRDDGEAVGHPPSGAVVLEAD